jgi:hypothetical protein
MIGTLSVGEAVLERDRAESVGDAGEEYTVAVYRFGGVLRMMCREGEGGGTVAVDPVLAKADAGEVVPDRETLPLISLPAKARRLRLKPLKGGIETGRDFAPDPARRSDVRSRKKGASRDSLLDPVGEGGLCGRRSGDAVTIRG